MKISAVLLPIGVATAFPMPFKGLFERALPSTEPTAAERFLRDFAPIPGINIATGAFGGAASGAAGGIRSLLRGGGIRGGATRGGLPARVASSSKPGGVPPKVPGGGSSFTEFESIVPNREVQGIPPKGAPAGGNARAPDLGPSRGIKGLPPKGGSANANAGAQGATAFGPSRGILGLPPKGAPPRGGVPGRGGASAEARKPFKPFPKVNGVEINPETNKPLRFQGQNPQGSAPKSNGRGGLSNGKGLPGGGSIQANINAGAQGKNVAPGGGLVPRPRM
ncbi:hypothetical protein CDD82_455 [Ophiocordyceps australis]|uniref:Uncharacterized protein n=1 Tax=Ophiocordyceps australis TaxID=1399860 RepID=A0A2C5Y0Y0_9HYPO|nr:hypothetical protein CDD82_455 [Ophiocordyceps australis]